MNEIRSHAPCHPPPLRRVFYCHLHNIDDATYIKLLLHYEHDVMVIEQSRKEKN